ncbi:MAG TPA: DUF2339 domain-containing protein, partial [Stellaceae bacterium]|nr:DUF2339 domain-containing protein [Stellaceae bacterium]
MDWENWFPLFAIVAVAAFALGLRARSAGRRLRDQIAELTDRLRSFDHRLTRLEQLATPADDSAAAAAQPAAFAPLEPVPAAAEPAAPLPEPEPAVETPIPVQIPARQWEQLLVEHWLVWLGGATIALGGAFLVKLSIDYGLMTPVVRVVLGIALGIGLSVGAEWVKRREPADDAAAADVSYVPPALAASGAATIFASFYAAYALYGLLPGGLVFVLLAVTAGATVAQSLRHGPLVAALGLVGAYVVPLLVVSDNPHALPLFGYLAVVTAGSLALLRHRAWWWLAWLSLAGALGWVLLWLGNARAPEVPVVALYLLVQFGLFYAFRTGVPRVAFLAGVADDPILRAVIRVALWSIAVALLALAHADHFGTTSIGAAILVMTGLLAFAYRDAALDDLIAVAGALALVLLAGWDLPLPLPDLSLKVFRIHPDHLADFATAAIVFTALLSGGGFAVLPRVARPGRWGAISAAAPLAILIISYWRLQKFELDVAWTLTALSLAGIELGAAAIIAQRRAALALPDIEIETALAAYAVGVLGSTVTAAAFGLGDAWLTVALALHLPAMGWVDGRIRVKAMRWVALGIAAIVVARLVLNPYVLDYPIGAAPIFNWLLYGYGVPAAAFIVATRQFGSRADDALVWVLEAGSALFSLALLSFELIHAIYGRLGADPLEDFAAGAALLALWLAFAAGLIALGERRRRPVLRWGGRLLLTIATVILVPWQLLMLLFGTSVGDLPILDALLLADAVPAAIFAMIAWLGGSGRVLRLIARVLVGVFGFAWITLEIRHAFHARVELFAGST